MPERRQIAFSAWRNNQQLLKMEGFVCPQYNEKIFPSEAFCYNIDEHEDDESKRLASPITIKQHDQTTEE